MEQQVVVVVVLVCLHLLSLTLPLQLEDILHLVLTNGEVLLLSLDRE